MLVPSSSARILIASQAPGTKVHVTGIPFNDASGDRLRDWLAVDREAFYDPSQFAIVPMGFCFPGQDSKGGDLPPRRECAPTWRSRVMSLMPQIELVLTIGLYAQSWHLGAARACHAHRDGAELAGSVRRADGAQGARAAAPILAQHRLAQEKPLVRSRASPCAEEGGSDTARFAVMSPPAGLGQRAVSIEILARPWFARLVVKLPDGEGSGVREQVAHCVQLARRCT